MVCTTVTVNAPELNSATISGLGGSGGTNKATLSFKVSNPNSVPVNVEIQYKADGSTVDTESVGLSANGSKNLQREVKGPYNLAAGDNPVSSTVCADVIGTNPQ